MIARQPRTQVTSTKSTQPLAGLPLLAQLPGRATAAMQVVAMPAMTPVPQASGTPVPSKTPVERAETEPAVIVDEIAAEPARITDALVAAPPVIARTTPAIDVVALPEVAPAQAIGAGIVARRRKRALGWLVAAVAAGAAGGALLAVRSAAAARDRAAIRAALTTEAEHFASALQAQARAARQRAEGVAMAPMLRAAIDTDAATIQDLATSESLFTTATGESFEVFIAHGPRLVSAVRVPAAAPPLAQGETDATAEQTRLFASGGRLALAVTVPVSAQRSDHAGALGFATPIDLTTFADHVGRHARAATLTGLGLPVIVTGDDHATGDRISIPIPFDDGFVAGPVALEATVATIGNPRGASAAAYAYGCFALAGLLFAMAAVKSVARKDSAAA